MTWCQGLSNYHMVIVPETSECNKSVSMPLQKCFNAIAKVQNVAVFCSPNYYWAVLKNRYFRPCGILIYIYGTRVE